MGVVIPNRKGLTEMKWTKSSRALTKEKWQIMEPGERYAATRFWIRQNKRKGRMSRRSAITRVRRALKRAKVLTSPSTDMSVSDLIKIKYRPDPLLDHYLPSRKKEWKTPGRRRPMRGPSYIDVINVGDFSLLDDPKHVFQTITALCKMEAISPPCEIDFTDEMIRDIGAYLLYSIFYQKMVPFARGGRISSRVAKVFIAVGLPEMNRMKVREQDTHDVFPLPLSTQTKRNMTSTSIGGQTSKAEKVSTGVVVKVQEWLASVGVDYSDEVLAPLGEAIGEVLNNAERHSRSSTTSEDAGGWWITGFMARRENEDGTYRHVCHLAVVGLGLTIPQTLLNSPKNNPEFRPLYDDYGKVGGKKLSKEQKAFIVSLQDGVTSKPQDSRGGLGMQNLIANIAHLGGGAGRDRACIAIVSGRTCIRLNADHMIDANSGDGHRQSWLNSANDARLAPDTECVTNIGVDFPGTCISLRFELDQDHLKGEKTLGVEAYKGGYPVSNVIYRDM